MGALLMMNHGWECPKCHRCYAPMQMYCMTCNANPVMAGNSGNLQAFETNDPRSSQYVPPLNAHLYTSNALQEAGANAVAGGFQPDIGLNKGYNR